MTQIVSEAAKAKLRRFLELRESRDRLDALKKTAEEEYRLMEAEVFESLEDVPGTIPVDLGPPWGVVRFGTRTTTYAQILDEDELEAWLKEKAMQEEMVKPQFAKGRLNEIVRNVEEHGEEMPPGLATYTKRGVSIRRQK